MPNPQAGTSYTNLSQIIAANQQNQLGNTVQSGVQKGISGLNTNLNQAQQQFQTDVNNANLNTTGNQQNVQNTINSIVPPQAQTAPQQTTSSGTFTQPPVVNNTVTSTTPTPPSPATTTANNSSQSTTASQQPATPTNTNSGSANSLSSAPGSFGFSSNPTSGVTQTASVAGVTPNASQLAQFGQILQGNYAGPTQLNQGTLANLSTQAQNLQQTGQLVNQQGGLQSLLQQYVGGPNYSTGDQNLDAILLGQTGKQQLQNVLNSTQNLNNLPQTAAAQDQALAQSTAAGNQQLAQNTQNQLSSAQNTVLGQIANQIAPITQQNQAYDTAAQQIYNWLNTASTNPNGGIPAATSPYFGIEQNTTSGVGGNSTISGSQTVPTGNKLGLGPQITTAPGAFTAPFDPSYYANSTGFNSAQLNPQTDQEAAIDSLNLAAQSGILNPQQISSIQSLLPKVATSGSNDLKDFLAQTFSQQSPFTTDANGNIIAPSSQTPTMQQAATSQQAAQLNALEQLGGLSPQFSTYGGAANAVNGNAGATPLGFNATTLANLVQANPLPPPPQVEGVARAPNLAKGGTIDNRFDYIKRLTS